MGYENRFDGQLDVVHMTSAGAVEIPDELRTQAEALGLMISPKGPDSSVEELISSLQQDEKMKRFFQVFKYDPKTGKISVNLNTGPGSFYGFDETVKKVAKAFSEVGLHLSGELYRLGEERDDVERFKVDGRDVAIEQAEVVFSFQDGSLYIPPPL